MIQAGVTGPPHVPDHRIRVWSDVSVGAVRVRYAHTGEPVRGATMTEPGLPLALVANARISRRVVELGNLPSNALLSIDIGGETCRALTLPPSGGELRLLLASCFHNTEDHGRVAAAYDRLRLQDLPHLRIHCGDQLYLDAGALPDGPTAFDRSEKRYDAYWHDPAYSRFLRGGASIFAPDDHEFWNDYPYRMPYLSRSWDANWQEHEKAALDLFLAYQALSNPAGSPSFTLDLGLISLFMLDTRTRRGTNGRNPPKRLFDVAQRQSLTAWSQTLTKPGVLVSAMPLLQKPASKILFFTSDHNLLSFADDARAIWSAVEQAPHDVLVLAGDIHQGRAAEWQSGAGFGVRKRHELTSSPLSLLSWGPGSRGKGKEAPSGLDLGPMGKRDSTTTYATARDHFTLLRFNAAPAGVRVGASLLEVPTATVPPSDLSPSHPCQIEILLK